MLEDLVGKVVLVYFCNNCGCFCRVKGIIGKVGDKAYSVINGPIVAGMFWPEHATYYADRDEIEVVIQ